MSTHPLKAFRERTKPAIRQEVLAKDLKVTKATLSRWETGKRFPDRAHWETIKAVTGIGPEQLQAAHSAIDPAPSQQPEARETAAS